MLIKAKKIINSKVTTKSGQDLGRVVDFEIDSSGQNIIKYYTQGFLKESLIINSHQVIEIKEKEIIVEDMVIPTPNIEYAG